MEFYFNSVCSFFITLTYDDAFMPMVECEDGVLRGVAMTSELQNFFKRLRYYVPKFRYYAVSEYSPAPAFRPHFHILIYFNEFVDEKVMIRSVFQSWLQDRKNGLFVQTGREQVEKLTAGRITYVTMYVLVKAFNEDYTNIPDEFRPRSYMSRRPGIGDRSDNVSLKRYLDSHPFDNVMYFPDGHPINIPRYFSSRMFVPTVRRWRSVMARLKHLYKESEYNPRALRDLRHKYYLRSLKRSLHE